MIHLSSDTKIEVTWGSIVAVGHALYTIFSNIGDNILSHIPDVIWSLVLGFTGAAGAWIWNKVKKLLDK
ncbi:MAG TPA: hypothetical protein VL947_07050 [Cytophagales bacterium]|nr:hypothetical protein [Cytophagales bacterium]